MSISILQSYLNAQHIRTDVEENVDNLKKAVKVVKSRLTRKKQRVDIIPFTLVALDPKVKDIDPVVQLVESIIIKKWSAFKNSVTATKDKSTTYVRAVILESLSQLAKEDASTAVLIWLTARDVIKYYQIGSEEREISGFLQELANQTEENGQIAWGIKQNLRASEFKEVEVSIPAIKAGQIDEGALKQYLLDASVHPNHAASAGGGKNPHGFNNHNHWQWPQFFSQSSATGISEVVNSALSQQTKSLASIASSMQEGLSTFFTQLKPFFEELNASFANSISANNKRSELLWWKQTLYSLSLNTSYRSLDRLNAVVCMALDLTENVEAFYPESVDYLLKETLKEVHGEQVDEVRPLTDWLNDSSNLKQEIQIALSQYTIEGNERKPLLCAWANAMNAGGEFDFFTETGIDKKAELSASELAVWLFHGLQAHKLATAK